MIDENQINSAAALNSGKFNPSYDDFFTESAVRASFKDGVAWFKRALWHPVSEEPTSSSVLVLYRKRRGGFGMRFYNRSSDNAYTTPWREYIKCSPVKPLAWLDIDDIKPEET